ncbi:hypothetical protein LLG46_04725 [bacterium]|nr:hypothetical protein [bacterium]
MKRFSVVLLVFMLLASAASDALAFGKTTVDPNSAEVEIENNDSRLAQKISCSLEKKSVVQTLYVLSTLTGITLNAGFNDKDWQVRDRRMNVFVKDMPIGDLMNSIARVMKFKWKKTGDGDQTVYRLYMDRAAVITAEMRKQKETESAAKKLADARLSLVNTLADPDAWIDNSDQDNPYLSALDQSGTADAMSRLFVECPDLKMAMANGTELEINSAKLSQSGQEAMLDFFKGLYKMDVQYGRNPNKVASIPEDISKDMDKISLVLGNNTTAFLGYINNLSMNISTHSYLGFRFGFCDPKSYAAKIEGNFIDEVWGSDDSYEDIHRKYWQKQIEATMPEWRELIDISNDPEAQHSDDPDMKRVEKDVITPFKKYQLEDFARTLAEKFKLNIVSDGYPGDISGGTIGIMGQDMHGIEMSLGDLLSRVASACNANWWKRENTVELRKKDWYTLRQQQIPDEWMEHWREVFKDTGTLDLDDLTWMATLTKYQYIYNIGSDEILNGYKDINTSEIHSIIGRSDSSGLLKFYSTLTQKQKNSVFTEKGLDLLNIRWDKRPALEAWLGSPSKLSSPLSPESAVTALRLYGTVSQNDKVFNYKFEIKADKGAELERWNYSISFTTPKYVEPKKNQNTVTMGNT